MLQNMERELLLTGSCIQKVRKLWIHIIHKNWNVNVSADSNSAHFGFQEQLHSDKWMRNQRPNCHLEGTIPISADLMTRQNGMYKCGNSDYQIVNHRRMLEHTTKHTGVNTFLCRGCGQTFTTFRQLVGHIKKEH